MARTNFNDWMAAYGITRVICGEKNTVEGLIHLLMQAEAERDFYQNLANELIKEKQKRIREEKGVVYLTGEMFIKEPPTGTTLTDFDFDRCEGCICQCCEKEDCEGCDFKEERCPECVDLTDFEDEEGDEQWV